MSVPITYLVVRANSWYLPINSGHVWYAVPPDQLTKKHYYAWRLWTISLPVDAEGWLEFCVRTWDSSNNTEPTFVRSAWK